MNLRVFKRTCSQAILDARPDTLTGFVSMLLMIDNYDSFTYNLVQYLGELGQQVKVVRNDALDVRRHSRAEARRTS